MVAIQLFEKSFSPFSTRNSGSEVCTASGVSFDVFTEGSVIVCPVTFNEGGPGSGGAIAARSLWVRLVASSVRSSAARIARNRGYEALAALLQVSGVSTERKAFAEASREAEKLK